jgi:hypothetical protein
MTFTSNEAPASLGQLATHLTARREALLNNWRTACEADSSLKAVASLSRDEFNNRGPFLQKALLYIITMAAADRSHHNYTTEFEKVQIRLTSKSKQDLCFLFKPL